LQGRGAAQGRSGGDRHRGTDGQAAVRHVPLGGGRLHRCVLGAADDGEEGGVELRRSVGADPSDPRALQQAREGGGARRGEPSRIVPPLDFTRRGASRRNRGAPPALPQDSAQSVTWSRTSRHPSLPGVLGRAKEWSACGTRTSVTSIPWTRRLAVRTSAVKGSTASSARPWATITRAQRTSDSSSTGEEARKDAQRG